MIILYGTRPRGCTSLISTFAGILWNCMYSKKFPMTSFRFVLGLLSQYFFPIRNKPQPQSPQQPEAITPHQSRLEFRELIRMKLVPREDQPHHVLGQQRERPEVEDLVPVLVHELQHLQAHWLFPPGRAANVATTFWTRVFVHLYWMYRSAEASNAQTVSTLMQHCTKPAHALRSSSKP